MARDWPDGTVLVTGDIDNDLHPEAVIATQESIEIVGLIVTAIGTRKGPTAHFRTAEKTERQETMRDVSFAPEGFRPTAVVPRETIAVGEPRIGPLIVEEALSTTVVPPGCTLTVLESGSMLIDLPAKES